MYELCLGPNPKPNLVVESSIMKRLLSAVLVAGALTASALAQQVFDLTMNPNKGQKFAYEMKLASQNMQTEMGAFNINVNLKTVTTFLDVTEKEIVSEDEVTKFEVLINGNPIDAAGEQMAGAKTKITRGRDGKVLKIEGGSPMQENATFQNMMNLAIPTGKVKVGDEVTTEIKADKEKKIKAGRIKMNVAGTKVVDGKTLVELKIAFSELEGDKPMGMVGTAFVEAGTGMLHSMKAAMNDISFNEMMPPMNMTMEMNLVSL